jgi:aryl-alcohol dehydrogenase-like predicted oxidoreductase
MAWLGAACRLEDEFVPLGIDQGIGVMVWSPLGSSLLSGKYRPSRDGAFGGRPAAEPGGLE